MECTEIDICYLNIHEYKEIIPYTIPSETKRTLMKTTISCEYKFTNYITALEKECTCTYFPMFPLAFKKH